MYEDADRLAAAFYECDQFALAGHRHYLVSGGHAMVSLVMCSANGHSWAKPCDVVDDSYLQNSVEELETHGTLRPIFNKVYKLFANQVFALVPTVRFIWISHRDTIRGLHRAHQGDVRLTPGNPVPERGLTRERITRSPADTLLPRLSAYESCVEAESGLSDEKATSQYFAPPPNGVAW